MSTISADQLPSPMQATGWNPTVPYGAPVPPPATAPIVAPIAPWGGQVPCTPAASPRMSASPARSRLGVTVSAAVVGVLALGGLGMKALGHDSSGTRSATHTTDRESDGHAGNSSIDESDLDDAYTLIFGLSASSSVLDCVADGVDDEGPAVKQLLDGETLSFDEAESTFKPFARCAPDEDFLAGMVPAAVAVIGGSGDEACISEILVGFGTAGRAEALALAYANPEDFATRMYNTFVGCAV